MTATPHLSRRHIRPPVLLDDRLQAALRESAAAATSGVTMTAATTPTPMLVMPKMPTIQLKAFATVKK